MIRTGMKISPADWREKIETNPDFVEIVLKEDDLASQQELIREMHARDIPWFGHLPTTYKEREEIFLLNIASANEAVRDKSRNLLTNLTEELHHESKSQGWIIHTPTAWNFSTQQKLFDRGCANELHDALQWISSQVHDAYVENVPPALKWDGNIYYTESFDMKPERPVVDTGHLYASTRSNELFLDEFTSRLRVTDYFHLASLTGNEPYDSHGKLFAAEQKEYPDVNLLRKVLVQIVQMAAESAREFYLVCEPGGSADLHITNITKLRKEIAEITSQIQ